MSIYDYSADPALNQYLGTVYIGEGWLAPDVNNAIRQMMADLAVFRDSGSPGVDWGNINGNINLQADLIEALNAKQDVLISGVTIKTINGEDVIGAGDLLIAQGPVGPGLPAGGSIGQVPAKLSLTDYNIGWIDLKGSNFVGFTPNRVVKGSLTGGLAVSSILDDGANVTITGGLSVTGSFGVNGNLSVGGAIGVTGEITATAFNVPGSAARLSQSGGNAQLVLGAGDAIYGIGNEIVTYIDNAAILRVGTTGAHVAGQISVNDPNFRLYFNSAQYPTLNFDSAGGEDSFRYDRTGNRFEFISNGAAILLSGVAETYVPLSLRSGGTVIAGVPGTGGFAQMAGSDSVHTGLVGFHRYDGVRIGYIGNATTDTDNVIQYVSEVGGNGHRFHGPVNTNSSIAAGSVIYPNVNFAEMYLTAAAASNHVVMQSASGHIEYIKATGTMNFLAAGTIPMALAGNYAFFPQFLGRGSATSLWGEKALFRSDTAGNPMGIFSVYQGSDVALVRMQNNYVNVASARMFEFDRSDGVQVGSIYVTSSNTAYNTTSDIRLKENIAPAASAGSIIDAIQVVSHDWIGIDAHTSYGVLAQDLHAIFPDAVTVGGDELTEDRDEIPAVPEVLEIPAVAFQPAVFDEEGELISPEVPPSPGTPYQPAIPAVPGQVGGKLARPWGVDYSKMVPLLIKEVQELRARVAHLEGHIHTEPH